jgi:hypothetical protein
MSTLTKIEAGYAAELTALVAAGTDKPLPIYNVSTGLARMVPASEFLGECHKAAQGLLFRACAEAEKGNGVMAVSLLKAFTQEVAAEYGVTTAEAVELISDAREAA